MAKITKSTDKSGRTVYKIAGTKKYAFTLAKAKEIAAKGSTSAKAPARRTSRGHGSVEEGYFDTKGRRAVRVKKVTAKQAVARAVPRPTHAKLMNFYRDIKEMGGEALAERGIKPATDAFALKVRAALEDAMDELEGPRRKSVAYISASGKPAIRRTTKRNTSTGSAKRRDEKYVKVFHANMPDAVGRYTPAGVAATKRLLAAFKKDPHTIAEKYGVGADYVSAGFIKRIEGDLKYLIEDYAHLRKEDRAIAAARKSGRLPALRGSGKTSKPKRSATRRKTATAKPKKTASRRKAKTRTPKIIGRAYINRYGERVGPTRILGRTVDYAMKIVRTKGRDLKATPAHRKEIVAKYRKALQKAGFLRGAATRRNAGTQYFKEVICEGGTGGGGCGSPLAIHKITQETFEAARGPKRSNAWFEHNEDEGPEVDGPFKVVLGYRLCRDCRE